MTSFWIHVSVTFLNIPKMKKDPDNPIKFKNYFLKIMIINLNERPDMFSFYFFFISHSINQYLSDTVITCR